MIVQLGQVQFNVDFGYEALERVRNWNWEPVEIIGDDPILHYTGRTREFSFEGTHWNYAAFADAPLDLETLGDSEEPHALTDDLGNFYGFWAIVSVTRAERHFRRRQKTGLETKWQLRLKYYGASYSKTQETLTRIFGLARF